MVKKKTKQQSFPSEPAVTTIGAYPKARSSSSQRVQGFQLMTSHAGVSRCKRGRQRARDRAQKRQDIGSIVGLSRKQALDLAQKHPGSWLAPTNREAFYAQMQAKSVGRAHQE
jgi:hypothetical protein